MPCTAWPTYPAAIFVTFATRSCSQMWPRGSGIDTLVRKWRVCSMVCFSSAWAAADLALLSKSFLALCGLEAWPCCASQAPSCGELLAIPVACSLHTPGPPPSSAHLSPSSAAQRPETKGGSLGSPGGKTGMFI